MKFKIISLFLLFINTVNAQQWISVGNQYQFGQTYLQDLTVLPDGTPVIAFVATEVSDVIKVKEWRNNTWQSLPDVIPTFSPSPLLSDLSLIHIEDTLYMAIGNDDMYGIGYGFNIFKFDGVDWVALDGATTLSENYASGTLKLSGSNEQNDLAVSFSVSTNSTEPRCFKYVGGNWLTNFGADLQTIFTANGSSTILSDLFHNGPFTYYYCQQSQEGGEQKVNGSPELRLYKYDTGNTPNWDTLMYPTIGGLPYIQESPNLMSMTGNTNGGEPLIAYTSGMINNNATIRCKQLILNNDYTDLIDYTTPGGNNILKLDATYDNTANPIISYVDNGTSNSRKVIRYNGSGWDLVGGEFNTTDQVNFVDVEVFESSNKIYVLFNSSAGCGLKVYNSQPIFNSYIQGPSNLCQNETSTLISEIEFSDINHDSLYITAITSTNTAVIANANISWSRTSVFDPASSQNRFSVNVLPTFGQSGVVNLSISITDGLTPTVYTFQINVNSLPPVSAGTNSTICQTQNVTLTGSGADSYTWIELPNASIPINGEAFIINSPGMYLYECTGTDLNGCINKDTLSITVNPLPTFTVTPTNVICNGNSDGGLVLDGLNANTSYPLTYTGTMAGIVDSPSEQSNASGQILLSGLMAESFTNFMITDPNGCQASDVGPYIISEPTEVILNAPMSYNSNEILNMCEVDAQAGVTFQAILAGGVFGGTGTLTATWDNGVIDNTAFNPIVGTTVYTLSVIDVNGCTATDLTNNTITVIVEPTPTFTTSSSNPTTCGGTDGFITFSGLNSNTIYNVTYQKDAGATGVGPVPFTTTATGEITLSGLDANVYDQFQVESPDNCLGEVLLSITLTDPNGPIVNQVTDQTYCTQTGSSLIAFTGTAGATFNWINDNTSIGLFETGTGIITPFTTINTGASDEIATITVTPIMFGCTGTMVTFSITVNPLEDATFNYSASDYCLNDENQTPTITGLIGGTFTGFVSLNVTTGEIDLPTTPAGTNTVTYTTSGICPTSSTQNIAFFTVPTITTTTVEICSNNGDYIFQNESLPIGGIYSGPNIQNNTFNPNILAAGDYIYFYEFTDGNGCSESENGTITINPIPTVSLAITNASCGSSGGAVDATISGGASPYSIVWSSGETSENITGVSPNNYYINVIDGNECYVMEVATVTSTEITLSGSVTDNLCNAETNGSIDLTISGTTGPYIYYWSNGATTEDVSNLASGQYEVFVTNQNNCTSTMSFIVGEPNTLNATISQTNPSTCGATDGSLMSTVTGGGTSYTYDWLDNTNASVGTTANLTSIGGGVYTLNITDENGCTTTTSSYITDTGAPVVTLVQSTDASCDNDGAIDVEINSTNTIQSTVWSNGELTEDITNLSVGNYSLTVTDNNGCQGYFSTTLNPILPEVTNICIVTVDTATNTNLIVWEKPITTEIDYYVIFRETSVANEFLPVDTVQYDAVSQFTDPVAYPQIRSWRYKIKSVNTCGYSSNFGDIHKTIHITISSGLSGSFNLHWDEYEGFDYTTFDIWRFTSTDGWGTIPIQSVPSNQFSLTDTPPSDEGLDYIIEITPPNVCTSTTIKAIDHNSSRSNKSSGITAPPGGSNSNSIIQYSEMEIGIYPNPSTGIFNIKFNDNGTKTFKLYDMKGSIVTEFNSSLKVIQLDLSRYENGMYILEVYSKNTVIRKQLLKQ